MSDLSVMAVVYMPGAQSNVSTKYRCHRVCHLQMSLLAVVGVGRRAGAEPLRSAAPDRRPLDRSFEIAPVFYRAGVSSLGA